MQSLWLLRITAGIAAMMAVPAVALAQDCNPPHQYCDDDGIHFRCPPCPPGTSARPTADKQALEQFRTSLEDYRQTVEADRAQDPAGPLHAYRQGIDHYREGQADYRSKARAADTGSR